MNGGNGFEFTPFGIVPLGTAVGQMAEGAIAGATADVGVVVPEYPVQPMALRAPPAMPMPARAPLKPVDVVKLAKARLREVEREIARLKKLEPERDELCRLIAAAENKPARNLRSLPTRSA